LWIDVHFMCLYTAFQTTKEINFFYNFSVHNNFLCYGQILTQLITELPNYLATRLPSLFWDTHNFLRMNCRTSMWIQSSNLDWIWTCCDMYNRMADIVYLYCRTNLIPLDIQIPLSNISVVLHLRFSQQVTMQSTIVRYMMPWSLIRVHLSRGYPKKGTNAWA
jgi:hypothetical protein